MKKQFIEEKVYIAYKQKRLLILTDNQINTN